MSQVPSCYNLDPESLPKSHMLKACRIVRLELLGHWRTIKRWSFCTGSQRVAGACPPRGLWGPPPSFFYSPTMKWVVLLPKASATVCSLTKRANHLGLKSVRQWKFFSYKLRHFVTLMQRWPTLWPTGTLGISCFFAWSEWRGGSSKVPKSNNLPSKKCLFIF